MVSLCSVLENAAADELAHDGVARDVIGFERRDGVDDLEEVGQPVLVDEGVVKLGVELGDLLEIAREDTRLVVVEGVDVDARVGLIAY